MSIHVQFPSRLRTSVSLPTSKSVSARALIIGGLGGGCRIENLSDCEDTQVMLNAQREAQQYEIDIKAAGTAMRFLTAFYAATPGEHLLTGTARMKQRPIRILVEALRQLGADIDYAGEEGFPPLHIRGRKLRGGNIVLPGDVSSQYISALLLIAPTLSAGLTLQLTGEVASRPYIDMTLSLMRRFGAQAAWTDERSLRVEAQPYRTGTDVFVVEKDWSAASYWYEMVLLSKDDEASVFLSDLKKESVQGDAVVAELFTRLGVRTTFEADGAWLSKDANTLRPALMEVDFTDFPDLAQTLVCACVGVGQAFRFTGLQSLKIKETDRILALQTELLRLGVSVEADERSMFYDGRTHLVATDEPITTYNDHRMAMAFAPLALRLADGIHIADEKVVGKSYPAYWEDLNNI